jgi:hypothetical protein
VQLVYDLICTDGSGDRSDLRVVGPLAYEVVAVEVAHASRAVATGDRRHVVYVGIVSHRGHRRVEIEVLELCRHVRIKGCR